MYDAQTVAVALRMVAEGKDGCAISRHLGVPRSTVRDWVAGELPRSFRLAQTGGCPLCGGEPHEFEKLPSSYVYLLGLYLGDGCISIHPRGVFKLRISLDRRYPEIAGECEAAMHGVLPTSIPNHRTTKTNCIEVYAYSKAWPCFFPQHGPGKKHDRRIVLADWQTELIRRGPCHLLRGLIHSDGCRFQNCGRRGWSHPRYSFTNFSADIRGIFCDACNQLDLHWTPSGDQKIYVSRKADVAILDRLVGAKH